MYLRGVAFVDISMLSYLCICIVVIFSYQYCSEYQRVAMLYE